MRRVCAAWHLFSPMNLITDNSVSDSSLPSLSRGILHLFCGILGIGAGTMEGNLRSVRDLLICHSSTSLVAEVADYSRLNPRMGAMSPAPPNG